MMPSDETCKNFELITYQTKTFQKDIKQSKSTLRRKKFLPRINCLAVKFALIDQKIWGCRTN